MLFPFRYFVCNLNVFVFIGYFYSYFNPLVRADLTDCFLITIYNLNVSNDLCRYYGVVSLIPIFQYSNVYAGTSKLRKLAEDPKLQKECLDYVTKSTRHPPNFRDVFMFYASMTRGTTVKDLCIRLNPHSKRINERKLVQFGVLHGFIQRIYKVSLFMSNLAKQIPPR